MSHQSLTQRSRPVWNPSVSNGFVLRTAVLAAFAIMLCGTALAGNAEKKLIKKIGNLGAAAKSGLKFHRKQAIKELEVICENLEFDEVTPDEAAGQVIDVSISLLARAHQEKESTIAVASALVETAAKDGEIGLTTLFKVGKVLGKQLDCMEKSAEKEFKKFGAVMLKVVEKINESSELVVTPQLRSEPVSAVPASEDGDPPFEAFTKSSIGAVAAVKTGGKMNVHVGGTVDPSLTVEAVVSFDGKSFTQVAFPTFQGTYAVQVGNVDLAGSAANWAEVTLMLSKNGGMPWVADKWALPLGN